MGSISSCTNFSSKLMDPAFATLAFLRAEPLRKPRWISNCAHPLDVKNMQDDVEKLVEQIALSQREIASAFITILEECIFLPEEMKALHLKLENQLSMVKELGAKFSIVERRLDEMDAEFKQVEDEDLMFSYLVDMTNYATVTCNDLLPLQENIRAILRLLCPKDEFQIFKPLPAGSRARGYAQHLIDAQRKDWQVEDNCVV